MAQYVKNKYKSLSLLVTLCFVAVVGIMTGKAASNKDLGFLNTPIVHADAPSGGSDGGGGNCSGDCSSCSCGQGANAGCATCSCQGSSM